MLYLLECVCRHCCLSISSCLALLSSLPLDRMIHLAGLAFRSKRGWKIVAVVGVLPLFAMYSLLFSGDCTARFLRKETKEVNGNSYRTPQASFDLMVQTSFSFNVAESKSQSVKRKTFHLTSWNYKAKGGLKDEDRILLADIYRQAESVFEFGVGESTLLADYVGVPRYTGLDSDPHYISMVRDQVSSHFRFLWADVGTTEKWGRPDHPTLLKNTYNYQISPLMTELKAFDVYLIDGRWRLPCMLASFLHASARRMEHPEPEETPATTRRLAPPHQVYDTHTVVVLHDCFQEGYSPSKYLNKRGWNRPVYRAADHLLELVDHSGQRLCVYKRRPSTSDQDLLDLWMIKYHQVE